MKKKSILAILLVVCFVFGVMAVSAYGLKLAPGKMGFGKGKAAKAANIWNVPGDFSTIQAAVNNASVGDTIIVGEYTGPGAVINKKVEIVGSGDLTVINSLPTPTPAQKAAFYFPADQAATGTKISNLTINCSAACLMGVYAENQDNIEVGHLVITNTQAGIYNLGGSRWEITHNKIVGLLGATLGVYGIYIAGSSKWGDQEVAGNLVAFNDIDGTNTTNWGINYRFGINLQVSNATPATIINNKVVHNRVRVKGGFVVANSDPPGSPYPWSTSIGLVNGCRLPNGYHRIVGNYIGFNDVRGSDWSVTAGPPKPLEPFEGRLEEIISDNPNISRNLSDSGVQGIIATDRRYDGIDPELFNPTQ